MPIQTEVFEGSFNLDDAGVKTFTASLEALLAVADKVTASLGKITLKAPKVDTTSFDNVGKAAEAAAEKVTKTLGKALSLQDVKKQTGLDDITAILQGQLASIPDKSQPTIIKLREQFADLKKQIGSTFDGQNIDFAKVDALKGKFAEVSAEIRRMQELQTGDAIDSAIKKVEILSNQSRIANQSFGAGIGKITAGLQSITSVNSLGGLVDSLNQVRIGAATVGNSMTNVKNGIELATRDGGNLFLGVRQAIFGVSSSTNSAAKALDFLAATFTKTTAPSDKLLISAQQISAQMAQFNGDMRLAAVGLNQVAAQEGISAAAIGSIKNEVVDVSKQFIRLNDVIQGGGKITPTQLSQVQNKSEQLLRTIDNLIGSGFVPLGSQTEKTLLGMRDKFLDNVNAGKLLEAQVKAIDAAQEKSAVTTTKSKAAFQAVGDTAKGVFGQIKATLVGAFQAAPPEIERTRSTVQSLNSEIQRTSMLSNIVSETLGTVFGNVIYGLISKATSAVSNFVGMFTSGFFESNNLVQNFDITLRQMMSGLDSGVIEGAIGNITDFIKEKVSKSPFELADAFQSFQRLATAGLDPKKWLTPVSDAAAAVNKPMDQLIGAMSRLQSGAKGIGIDMLRDFGIPVAQVGSYVDTTTGQTLTLDEVFKKNGDITKLSADELANLGIQFNKLEFDKQGSLVNDVSDAMDILNGYLQQNTTFAGAAEARSRSLTGVISNLRDVITNISILAGQPIFEKMTVAGQALLNALAILQPQLNRLATVIGTGIANAFDFFAGKVGNTDTLLANLAAGISAFTDFVAAVFAGDWTTAWGIFLSAVDGSVTSAFNILDNLVASGIDWGFSFVEQIANGIIDGASSILIEAVNYVSETISSFMQPGSPPKEGPLSTIDKWGSGLMDTLTGSMDQVDTSALKKGLGEVKNVFDKFDIGSAQADVANIQQQIIDAEAKGYVPAELKKQLSLAQDKVTLLQQQEQLQSQLNESQADGKKQEEKAQAKAGGGRTGTGESTGRVGVEKKTAEQIKNDALSVLDQQLKDGVIKYEDYAKERLKIENKFYEDTLKEGGKVSDQNIADIKKYQSEIERLKAEEKAAKAGGDIAGIKIPSGRDILAGFSDTGKEVATGLSEQVTKVVNTSIDQIKTRIVEKFGTLGTDIKNKLASIFTGGGQSLASFTGGGAEVSSFDKLLYTITNLVTYVQTNMPYIQATFLTVFKVVSDVVSSAFETIKSTYENSLKPSFDQLTATLGTMGISWGDVFTAFGQAVGIVFSIVATLVIGAIGLFTAFTNGILTGVAAVINNLSYLQTGFTQVFAGIYTAIYGFIGLVKAILQGDLTAVIANVQILFQGLATIGQGTFNTIVGTIVAAFNFLTGFVSGFIDGIVGFFSTLYQKLVGGSIIPELVDDILSYITLLKEQGITLIGDTIKGWLDKFTTAIDKFKDVGKNIIKGLLDGINKNKDKVIEVLKSLIDDAITSVQDLLWSNSPSLRFVEIGVNVIEGFNKGIQAIPIGLGDVIQTAADDVEKFLDSKDGILGRDKGKAALTAMKATFRDNFDEIVNLAKTKGKEVAGEFLGRKSGIGKLAQGGEQGKILAQSAEFYVEQALKQQAILPGKFAEEQRKTLESIGKLQTDITNKFNQSVFNIRTSATESRIELERLFNRTVTDAEVEKMAKAFEGTPVENLDEQSKLIYRNYLLQQKLTGATEQEAKVREQLRALNVQTAKAGDIISQYLPAPVVKQAQNAGDNILKALGLGIDAGAEDVLAQLGIISASIIDKIKLSFGIQSPSTVFTSFGQNISQGLAQGISNGLGNVEGAMGLMQQAIDPGRNLKVGKIGGGFDFATAGAGSGQGLQLVQYNTIANDFDMATFTDKTQQAIVQLLRTGR